MALRPPSVLAGAILLLLFLAGCTGCGGGVSRVLDATETGHQIADHLASTLALTPPAVTCPSGVQVRAHERFDCHTALEGQPLTVHVTLTDDQGHFIPAPGAAVVVVAKLAGAIRSGETNATLRCGTHAVLVEAPGATFGCTAATAAGPVSYRMTVKDLAGNVAYQPIQPQAG